MSDINTSDIYDKLDDPSNRKQNANGINYEINPRPREKFRPGRVKEIIKEILHQKLDSITNQPENIQNQCKEISEIIKQKLKELNLPRYKYAVQVFIGEQKGQGVRVSNKCYWDYETDHCASETYNNDHIFCLATAYGVYVY